LRSVRDNFQQVASSAPDLWYGMFCIYGDIPEEGVAPIDLVSTREPLAVKPCYQVGAVRRPDGARAEGFLFGNRRALEQFRSLGNAAYLALLDSPRKDIADSLPPPHSPRERFPRWLDVLCLLAGLRPSPLLSTRESIISVSLGDWTTEEESSGFAHVNSVFLEQNVFVASAAAIDLILSGPSALVASAVQSESDRQGTKTPRFRDWAFGLEDGRRWHVFKKSKGRWEHRGLCCTVPSGRRARLTSELARGGGLLSMKSAVGIESRNCPGKDPENLKHLIVEELSRFRSDLREAMGITEVSKRTDPLKYDETSQNWQAEVEIGYAIQVEGNKLAFRSPNELTPEERMDSAQG
jgi:hypothetical protein